MLKLALNFYKIDPCSGQKKFEKEKRNIVRNWNVREGIIIPFLRCYLVYSGGPEVDKVAEVDKGDLIYFGPLVYFGTL